MSTAHAASLGAAAEKLALAGIRVFPAKPRAKTPMTEHGFKDASIDIEQVKGWWAGAPEANVAIATGEGLVAVDIDPAKGGDESWAKLIAKRGEPVTAQVKTGGGGRHLYFSASAKISNSEGKLGPGLDVRGDGGYVIAPPSIHPNGSSYQWLNPKVKVADLPEWLAALLIPAPRPPRPQPTGSPSSAVGYGAAALRDEVATVRSATDGTRNGTLNQAAFSLGQLIPGGHLTESDVEGELLHAALGAGLGEREARGTIASGIGAGKADPRTVPPPGAANGHSSGRSLDSSRVLAEPPAPDINQGDPRPAAEPEATQAATDDDVGPGAYDDWLEPGPEWRVGADQDQRPALIPGILPLAGLTAIGGSKGIGKTWILTDLALSVANGIPFLGRYPVEAPGRVLVIQTEGSRRPAVARYDAIARGKGLDPAQALQGIDFVWRRGLMLDVEAHLAWLREKAPGYVAIIDDTLRDSHGGKENDNDDGAGLARNLRSITNQGPTFTYAHHTSKATADTGKLPILERLRGNTALTGALDGVLLLERHRSATRTTVEVYVRDDKAADPFTFTWPAEHVDGATPITLDWQPGEESVSSALELVAPVLRVVEEEPGQSRSQVADSLPKKRDLALAAIGIAIKQGRLEVTDTPYQDRAGRRRTREGLYLVPVPRREPENDSLGNRREPETPVPSSAGTEGLFEYGTGAGTGETGVLVTSAVRASGSGSLSLNREEPVPDRQTGGAEMAAPCPVCGGLIRRRPTKNSDRPWCDSCNDWADQS